jgi:DNA polymerase-1
MNSTLSKNGSLSFLNNPSHLKKRLIVIDSNAIIHRAYHALPPLTTKKGELVNAIYGFLLVFLKAIREFQPDFIVATFDLPAPTFRHEKFKEYKGKRPKAPDELYQQIPKVKEILKTFNVSIFEKEGFEADDVIGTVAKLAPKKQVLPEIETIILSGDLDTLQLVDKNTKVYALRKGVKDIILYDEEKVKEKFGGLKPSQLPDFKALRGDPSDNIPGVPGIGEKTAIQLIKQFGNIENLYSSLNQWGKILGLNQKTQEKLKEGKESAFFSKTLAQVRTDVPIDFNLEKCRWGKYNKNEVSQLLKDLEFYSLINRLP